MPKHKKSKRESSSDSDSGPEDRGPAPKKQAPSKPSSTQSSSKMSDDDPCFQLDTLRFVKVRLFKNKLYVDIREYYDKNGQLNPGKKGISLSIEQYKKLKDLIPEIDEAISK